MNNQYEIKNGMYAIYEGREYSSDSPERDGTVILRSDKEEDIEKGFTKASGVNEDVKCYTYVPLDDLTELYEITTTAIFKGKKCGIFRTNSVEDGMIWIMVTNSPDTVEIIRKSKTGYIEKYGSAYEVLVDLKDVELVERREDYEIPCNEKKEIPCNEKKEIPCNEKREIPCNEKKEYKKKTLVWLKSKDWILWVVAAILLMSRFFLPQTGDLVLVSEGANVVLIFGTIPLFVPKLRACKGKKDLQAIFWVWAFFIGFGIFGVWNATALGMDIVGGTEVMEITECSVSKYRGGRRLSFQHYKLHGIDNEGNRQIYEIDSEDYTRYKLSENITIEYYPHTERIKAFY